MMNLLNIVLQFMLSGAIVVGATLLAKHVDPKWTGFLVALPVMTILSLIFISINNSQEISQKYLASAILFMIPTVIYITTILITYGKIGLTASLLVSILPFFITVYIVQKVIN